MSIELKLFEDEIEARKQWNKLADASTEFGFDNLVKTFRPAETATAQEINTAITNLWINVMDKTGATIKKEPDVLLR